MDASNWRTVERLIEKMTWPEVQGRIDGGLDAVLIPIGTTEQHGPHMPLDTGLHRREMAGKEQQ